MENPTNFNNKIDVVQNYNKSPHRIIPSTGQADVKPGETTIFTMPIGTLDFDTFRLNFNATTDGDATHIVGFPQFMPCMIEQLDIYVNGVNVQQMPHYGFVYKLMKDYSCSYDEALLKVGMNPDPSVTTTIADDGTVTKYSRYAYTASTPVNQFTQEYCIDEWIGFLGSCQPRIWDTNMVGTMEVHIKWASAGALWGTAGSTFDYTISNLYGYIDKLDWKEGSYYDGLEKKLTAEGGFKIPYKNYRVHPGNHLTNTKDSITRFTESTQSLDKIILTFFTNGRATNDVLQLGTPANVVSTSAADDLAALKTRYDAEVLTGFPAPSEFNYETLKAKNDPYLLNTSKYFRRNGLGMKTAKVNFEINSQDIPSYSLSLLGQYEETLKAFELNDKDLHFINPGIRDLSRYERDFYACALSTSHINDKRDLYLISGKDTQATSMNIAVKVSGGTNTNAAVNCQPVVITEMSAVLHVNSGRQVAVSF